MTVLPRPATVAELLRRSRYEVIPLAGAAEQVLEHVPHDVAVTVTASPVRGLGDTLELSAKLAAHGYHVVPHLSARLVVDRAHLAELVAQISEMGVRDVFVIGGDADKPTGAFSSAAQLLDAMAEVGHPFGEIGIAGYSESHPIIDNESLLAAMFEKSRHATYIASQICFDSRATVAWIDKIWEAGTRLPVLIGIPGAVPRAKLLRVSTRIGIGESLRYLRKHRGFVTRVLQPSGFNPDKLISGLAPALTAPEQRVLGFHIFTFNSLADTDAWRQKRLKGTG